MWMKLSTFTGARHAASGWITATWGQVFDHEGELPHPVGDKPQ
jgi:hypothetical protein